VRHGQTTGSLSLGAPMPERSAKDDIMGHARRICITIRLPIAGAQIRVPSW